MIDILGGSAIDGNITDLDPATIQAADGRHLYSFDAGGNKTNYLVEAVQKTGGLVLGSGNFANPAPSFDGNPSLKSDVTDLDKATDLNLTVAREVDLATAIADDAPIGTKYKITDLDNASYEVVAISDSGGIYKPLNASKKLKLIAKSGLITSSQVNAELDKSTSDEILQSTFDNYMFDQSYVLVEGDFPVVTEKDKCVKGKRFTVDASGNYNSGAAGDINYFTYANFNAENALVDGLSFDGNGQATLQAYQSGSVNVWMIPYGFGVNAHRAKVRNVDIVDNGGHAVEGVGADMFSVIGITAKNHNGIGSTNGSGHIYCGIQSESTHDSHIYTNSANNVVISVATLKGTTNGGGIDVAGGDNVIVSGVASSDSKAPAVWILKSPNTGDLVNRVLVSGVVSDNNSQDPTTLGSLIVGDYNNPTVAQGQDYFLTGNLINITDTSGAGGSNFNNSVETHIGATNTTYTNNHSSGVISPSDANMIIDYGSTDSVYANNIFQFGTSYATVAYDQAPQGRGSVWRGNIGAMVKPSSPKKPTIMHDDDGYWRYTIKHQPTDLSAIEFMDVSYNAGFTRYIIEITAMQGGAGGMIQKRIALTGFQGGATVVNQNDDLVNFSAASGSPSISVDVTNNAKTRISITPATTDLIFMGVRVYGDNAGMNSIKMFPTQ